MGCSWWLVEEERWSWGWVRQGGVSLGAEQLPFFKDLLSMYLPPISVIQSEHRFLIHSPYLLEGRCDARTETDHKLKLTCW